MVEGSHAILVPPRKRCPYCRLGRAIGQGGIGTYVVCKLFGFLVQV